MTKRYAIVRVDRKCPAYENINLCDEENTTCEDCKVNKNYGDTKEQIVRKVATAILRTLKDGEVLKYEEFGTGFIKQPVSVEYLAERIVEFLGVE